MKLNAKHAAVTLSTLLMLGSAAHAQESAPVLPAEAQAPAVLRRSTVSLPFDVPAQALTVVVAHRLPAGATPVPGSSLLGGKPVADPVQGASGVLYWTLPASALLPGGAADTDTAGASALRGLLSYELTQSGALPALDQPALSVVLPGNRTEVLQGQIDAADFASASAVTSAPDTGDTENAGAIKFPVDGSVIRLRDRITVTVEAPQGTVPTLSVNGTPVSEDLIGTNTQDGAAGKQRLTYVGVPIRPGPNTLSFLGQTTSVYLTGATARTEITPVSTVADGSTPIRIRIRTLDAFGHPSGQQTITVNSSLEPRVADANPIDSGFQVRLTDGEGVLELQPQSAPVPLRLDVQEGSGAHTYRFDITPGRNSVGVGLASATLGLDGDLSAGDLTWQARAYYEGPVGAGKLYVAADKDRLPTDENTLVRNPVYGDASTEQVPLQGIDPVALSYDHPSFRAEYRRSALPIDVLPVGEQLTALTAYSKTNPQVSGFVASVPGDRVSELRIAPEGTRLLHLPDRNISEGSETIEVLTLERQTGKELSRVTLARNVDYVLDPRSGVVTLTRALDRLDGQLNERAVAVSYRLSDPLGRRTLAYGAQVKYAAGRTTVGAAAVSLDGQVTAGVRGTYADGSTTADALVAYSGGVQASASVSASPAEGHALSARVRYQQPGYAGLGKFADGLEVTGNYTGRLTPRLSAVVDAQYRDVPLPRVADVENADHTRGGSVTARADYRLAPFSVGLGARYAFGDEYGLGAVASVGYHQEPVDVDIVHTQPLSGNLDTTTDITARFKVSRNVSLGLNDKVTWGEGHVAALTLDSTLGNITYAAGYELPTASGAGNRARFGVTTTLPLNDRLALGLRGSALYGMATGTAELGAGADLNYKTDRVSAALGTDVTRRDGEFGVVVRAGITGSLSDQLTLTADALAEFGQDRDGQRLSLGYAYRGDRLSSLGYARYLQGTLAGNAPELSTGLSAEYREPTWALRGGLETRTLLADQGSFTWQGSLGGTAYLGERFGVGAWGRVLSQPASQTTQYGVGLEGSFRALPGTWLTAGYNFKGFDGLTSSAAYTKPGAYLRLDLTLDETLGRKK